MDRREFLGTMGISLSVVAGCSEGDSGPVDSDGDGVIDSEDYAPSDPDVQRKSDLQDTTLTPEQIKETTSNTQTTTSPTTTAETKITIPTPQPTTTIATTTTPTTTTPTTTTPTTTTTAPTTTRTTSRTTTAPPDPIEVTDSYWEGTSRIRAYSANSVEGIVVPESSSMTYDSAQVYAGLLSYPDGRLVAEGYGPSVELSGGWSPFLLGIGSETIPTAERLYYLTALIPDGQTIGQTSEENIESIMETDPFEVTDDGGVQRSPHPNSLFADSGVGFERNVVEGRYILKLSGQTRGRQWSISFTASKSGYITALNRARGRARSEYVSYEMTGGTASSLAKILNDEAEANGFTGKREKVEMVIDVVQRLPYIPDDVSTGYDDYTKFIMETLPEMGGDCEDTAILLASILQSEPFGYDMILIQPPGHMAVGILGNDDLPGYYWELNGSKYYYIETTGEGWGIGDLPDEYKGVDAYTYQV